MRRLAAETLNRGLLAIRQLNNGQLDDSLLTEEPVWGDAASYKPDSLMGQASHDLYTALLSRPPAGDRPLADAALLRLRGERGISGLPSSGTPCTTYEGR